MSASQLIQKEIEDLKQMLDSDIGKSERTAVNFSIEVLEDILKRIKADEE